MATTDVLSAAEAERILNVSDKPEAVGRFVSAVSQQLDQLCGPVVVRTITAETHSGGVDVISLKYRPVSSVTTVTEYDGTVSTTLTAESNTAKATANYYLDADQGTIRRRYNGSDWVFPNGRGNVVVTYIAGRAANTAAVDAKFKAAAAMMLRNVWIGEEASGSETFGGGLTDNTQVATLLGPGLLNKVVAMLGDDIIDGVAVL